MKNIFHKRSEKRKVLVFSFNYFPDQSAGARRCSLLVDQLIKADKDISVTIFCSVPRRYGRLEIYKSQIISDSNIHNSNRVRIRRFWIPYFGDSAFASVASYSFYFIQVVFCSLFVRPQIIFGTSAKLLTSFAAAFAAKITGAKLFIDIRDTFSDNFFYFYRWQKRILIHSLILVIENIVLRCASSINIVSIGFKEAFYSWDYLLKKHSIEITNYPNGIERHFRSLLEKNNSYEINKDNLYHVVYAGNLGEGQDILSLLKDISSNENYIQKIKDLGVVIDIYGSGQQLKEIKDLISNSIDSNGKLHEIVFYKGLLSRSELIKVYNSADCLMLQLARYRSLSMVIPTKVIEYSATSLPILYGASGFTKDFINRIDGTIPFYQSDSKSFLKSIESSMKIKIDKSKRDLFLNKFDTNLIYSAYAKNILGLVKKSVSDWSAHSETQAFIN